MGVDNRLGWERRAELEIIFLIFKKHLFCMFPNKSLYLGHSALDYRPTSHAVRNENWGFKDLAG